MEKTLKKYQLYINGEYVDPLGGEWFDSMDPYRGTAWAQIPKASAADVDRAVTAAGRATVFNAPSSIRGSSRI